MKNQAPQPWPVNGQKLFVYIYHHIDHTPGISPANVHDSVSGGSCEARVPAIKQLFAKAGWEGDGSVEIFSIPPVIVPNTPDGFLIWHVKQSNNGTSWLATEVPLPENDELVGVPFQTKWP